jgi:hypothetical protein
MTEKYVENCYTRPSIRNGDALASRTEENLGDCSGIPILRKNKLLSTDKRVLLSAEEEIMEDFHHRSVLRE